ncbi:MAG: T9SS type A sorting domain-containing protein [Saprospiraceae bacterium]|nr:T9SS type A sorting domain-containing protein [Saprospiraceae bacterium]
MKTLSFVLGLLFLNSLNAQTLRPDSSFAEVGKYITSNEEELSGIFDIEFDGDGNIYMLGSGERLTADSLFIYLALGKLKSDGNFDSQFGNNGIVHTEHYSSQLYMDGSYTQSDGKILLAGHTFDMYTGELLTVAQRYGIDGKQDLTFGNLGTFTLSSEEPYLSTNVFELPSGKIIISATKWLENGRDAFSLIRLNNDGTIDEDFGDDGVKVFEYPDINYSIKNYYAIPQPDGKIIIAGHIEDFNGQDMLMMRFMEDGSLDSSFGQNGYFIFDGGGYDAIDNLSLQSDGKILFTGGSIDDSSGEFKNNLIAGRLNSNGSADESFGENGFANFDSFQSLNPNGFQIIEAPDGNIMLAGSVYDLEDSDELEADIFFIRMNKNGKVDNSLGNDGIYIEDFGGLFDNLYRMKFDAQGRIIVCGESINFVGPSKGFVAIYIPDLSLGKFELNNINSSVLTYPHPFVNECTIKYDLLKETKVSIDLLNVNGNLIKTFVNQDVKSSGSNQESISMEGLTPGIYLIRIKTELGSTTVKVIKQ